MKKLTYRCSNMPDNYSDVLKFYYDNGRLGVFDIETTGLNREKNNVILIGFLKIINGEFILYQYFAESILEESRIIEAFTDDLKDVDVLVTYNGERFDFPFMESRMRALQCEKQAEMFSRISNLDVYRILNGYSDLRKFIPNLSQGTVEEYAGISLDRKDEINGAVSVSLYYEYLSFPDKEILNRILLHNRDDVLQLYRLLPILRSTDIHRAFYEQGFPAVTYCMDEENPVQMKVTGIKFASDCMEVRGIQKGRGIDYRKYGSSEDESEIYMDKDERLFRMKIPLVKHRNMKRYFVADIGKTGIDTSRFEKYPQYRNGLLILKKDGEIFYLQVIDMIKSYLKGLV